MDLSLREERGIAIAKAGNQIERLDPDTYRVRSQYRIAKYEVRRTRQGWICSCPDHIWRGGIKCKHIWAVEFSLTYRRAVEQSVVIQPLNVLVCRFCESQDIVKKAKRYNKNGEIQRYLCKNCGRRFSINLGFEKMKASPQVITSAMQLYFTGESLRNVQKFLRLQGVDISHQTVYNWIGKYVSLMGSYLERVKPQVSDTWRADEMYLKIKGNPKYLYALMDDETRYWIAQQVGGDKWQFSTAEPSARTLQGRSGDDWAQAKSPNN